MYLKYSITKIEQINSEIEPSHKSNKTLNRSAHFITTNNNFALTYAFITDILNLKFHYNANCLRVIKIGKNQINK